MSITVAIHQPYYFPWLGFFHKMANCDIFIILDDAVQSKSDYVHRCKIKTEKGVEWLKIPIVKDEIRIDKLMIKDGEQDSRMLNMWQRKHWDAIEVAYKRAPFWGDYSGAVQEIFFDYHRDVCSLDMQAIWLLKSLMGIDCDIVFSSDMDINSTGNQRNLDICQKLNADRYLSGLGAKNYNDGESFDKEGIELIYSGFIHPVYPQLWGEFVEGLSALDYLFNCGGRL